MAILIYDRKCHYCRIIADITSQLSDIEVMPYQNEEAQDMLEEAFEDPGFTLYLFEDDRVYWGREAARMAAKKTLLPSIALGPVINFYPWLVKLFSELGGRREVKHPVCRSDRCIVAEEGGGMKKLEKGKDLLELPY